MCKCTYCSVFCKILFSSLLHKDITISGGVLCIKFAAGRGAGTASEADVGI